VSVDTKVIDYEMESARIKELRMNPDYLTREQIETERKDLEERARILESRIRTSKLIEEKIWSILQQGPMI
jgi:hypothetical protein